MTFSDAFFSWRFKGYISKVDFKHVISQYFIEIYINEFLLYATLMFFQMMTGMVKMLTRLISVI